MKKKMVCTLFLGVLISVALTLGACGGQEQKTNEEAASSTPIVQTTQNFDIDPLKVAGDTPEARVGSLVNLLNSKMTGFAKLSGSPQKVMGATEAESLSVYNYVLMVYGDQPADEKVNEEYLNKILGVVKQVVAYSTKFVADANEQSIARVQVSYPSGDQEAYVSPPDGMKMLRASPTESWLQFVQPIPLIVVTSGEWQEARQLIALFQVGLDEGYISEEEFNKMVEKINELQQAQGQTGPAP